MHICSFKIKSIFSIFAEVYTVFVLIKVLDHNVIVFSNSIYTQNPVKITIAPFDVWICAFHIICQHQCRISDIQL